MNFFTAAVTPEEPTVTDPGPSSSRDDDQFPQSPFSDDVEGVQSEGDYPGLSSQPADSPPGYPSGHQPGYQQGSQPGYAGGYPQQGGYPPNGYGAPVYPPNAYAAPGYPGAGYPPNAVVSPKSKIAGALLAFFLGSVGAHNFYFGKTGKAVAQLVMAVIGWIGVFAGIGCIGAGAESDQEWVAGSSGYGYYSYSDNDGLIIAGGIIVIAAGILLTAVAIWAFVEFIMILSNARSYQFDKEGRLVQ
ncbi:TM2 domain-containing protein [uncultured Corynebacterium sp.]|uniref:TM2 domain-containing protein n=1 Tax=uncultured Corynebacterium sp. TaxID=159447 RepID=UPI0025E6AB8E|nr:TM2 domain-containing protein [uncultured Corynebacterium sp.]